MAAEIIQLPTPKVDEDVRLPPRRPPATIARVDQAERWNTGTRFGDLRGSQLAAILAKADKGDVAEWCDLVEFMLEDDLLGSLHQTRVLRVTQADWVITPNKFGDQRLARLAAELVNELMGMIRDWSGTQKKLLHAIAAGFAAGQKVWEYDRVKRRYWVRRIDWVHNHRFTYDEAWNLRLYDRGQLASKASSYGRALDPDLWIVHRHQPNAGYPGRAGQCRQVAWIWMMRRWVDKWHAGGVETAGRPPFYAQVPPNTTRAVRDQIEEDLRNLADQSAGVVNDDVTIVALDAQAATKSWEAYTTWKTENERRMTINYLGASDLVTPGANGSQAAVSTRTGATADPRMVDDGDTLSTTLQDQLFEGFIRWNAHLLGVSWDQADTIPLPEMRRKTADDEVRTDRSDRVSEIQDEAAANVGPDGKPLPGVTPPQLQKHADAVAKVAQGVSQGADDDPGGVEGKAGARASTRAGKSGEELTSTRSRWATSSPSRTPLEQALLSGSAGSARSSKKRSSTQPTR